MKRSAGMFPSFHGGFVSRKGDLIEFESSQRLDLHCRVLARTRALSIHSFSPALLECRGANRQRHQWGAHSHSHNGWQSRI